MWEYTGAGVSALLVCFFSTCAHFFSSCRCIGQLACFYFLFFQTFDPAGGSRLPISSQAHNGRLRLTSWLFKTSLEGICCADKLGAYSIHLARKGSSNKRNNCPSWLLSVHHLLFSSSSLVSNIPTLVWSCHFGAPSRPLKCLCRQAFLLFFYLCLATREAT